MSAVDLLPFLRGLGWTLILAIGAFTIGATLGLPILMARQSKFRIIRLLTSVLIQTVRAFPPILWLFMIFFGLGISLFPISPLIAALSGLGLIAAANMAEIYRGALNSIHHGQWEACAALDLSGASTIRDIIAPQAFRVALPSAASYLIGLTKETAVASTIGATELVYQANRLTQLTYQGLAIFAFVGMLYILISLPVAWFSRAADKALRARVAR